MMRNEPNRKENAILKVTKQIPQVKRNCLPKPAISTIISGRCKNGAIKKTCRLSSSAKEIGN